MRFRLVSKSSTFDDRELL